jgi:hypothetical protein
MFSAKNYGLPKDLIEAAKRVHEKQLEEQQKPTSLKQAVERVGLAVQGVIPKKANKPSAKDVYKAMGGTEPKRAKKPQSEEVQFTEEELAEAFAIFLEENFHVEMLTEEDLDYVFEEEFPQWLEESLNQAIAARPERTGKSAQEAAKRLKKPVISQSSQDAHVGLTKAARQDKKGISSRKNILKANPPTTKTDQTTREGRPVTSGGTLPSSVVQGDTEGGYTSAPKPDVRKQVSRSRPAPSARRQTGAPKGSFTAYRKRLGLGGDLKSAQSERYKKAYRTYRAAKYPKKDNWRSSVFNPEN